MPNEDDTLDPTPSILPVHPEAVFSTFEELRTAADDFARPHGYSLVIKKSRSNGNPRKILACDRWYKPSGLVPSSSVAQRSRSSSRGCNCEMEITARMTAGVWHLEHHGKERSHNHTPSGHQGVHPTRRRRERRSGTHDFSDSAVVGHTASKVLTSMALANPEGLSTLRDVQNELARARRVRFGDQTRLAYLIDSLQSGYFWRSATDSTSRITRLFVARHSTIQQFATTSDIICMDCTYKTNRYNLQLLNIIGVSGMNTTLPLAYCFLEGEDEYAYEWALATLKELLYTHNIPLPRVFSVDRSLALINALETLFPDVPFVLCLWHLRKDIQKHARQNSFFRERSESGELIDSKDHKEFCSHIEIVLNSPTAAEYENNLQKMRELSPTESDYIEDHWLDIFKGNIVACWVNQNRHFGQTATSRVEGYHSQVKRYLQSSRLDLEGVHQRITQLWDRLLNEHSIKVAKEQQIDVRCLNTPFYRGATQSIHNYALFQVQRQQLRIRPDSPLPPCSKQYFSSMGIPCAHMIQELQSSGRRLQPHDFDIHWWIDRGSAPAAPPQPFREPSSIAERREERARIRSEQREQGLPVRVPRRSGRGRGRGGRGSGPTGTRVDMLAYERSEQQQQEHQQEEEEEEVVPETPLPSQQATTTAPPPLNILNNSFNCSISSSFNSTQLHAPSQQWQQQEQPLHPLAFQASMRGFAEAVLAAVAAIPTVPPPAPE